MWEVEVDKNNKESVPVASRRLLTISKQAGRGHGGTLGDVDIEQHTKKPPSQDATIQ
jgi:hypothetical protein